jgi:serine/threonine protein kinase
MMDRMLRWPDQIDVPLETFLGRVGRVVRRFGERADSRTTIVGVETDQGRFIVKHATDEEAISWLASAVCFHAAVSHPSIAAVVHHLGTPDGLALVERWAPGEVLVDAFDPAAFDRDHPESPYRRFLSLPVSEISEAVRQLFHAHLAVTGAGFVAVDLYDGCVVYDFDAQRLSLIDLDMYREGPYVLDADRQYGSNTFMAPEEWQRGATIDERTTVFTLGRFALVMLGCERHGPARRADFRGTDDQFEIAQSACAPQPADRIRSVAELCRLWTDAAPETLARRRSARRCASR